jgi:hypothetical protein
MNFVVLHYSVTNSDLPSKNIFRFQSNVVKINCIWESVCNFFDQFFEFCEILSRPVRIVLIGLSYFLTMVVDECVLVSWWRHPVVASWYTKFWRRCCLSLQGRIRPTGSKLSSYTRSSALRPGSGDYSFSETSAYLIVTEECQQQKHTNIWDRNFGKKILSNMRIEGMS